MTDQENQELPEENQQDTVAEEAVEEAEVESLEGEASELELAQAEVAKLKDSFLRAKAEQDNIRRRAEKEVANGRKFAVEGFSKEMINVFDSLKLAAAVEVADDADDAVKSIHEGGGITLNNFKQRLLSTL